jgi:Icc-related predicted phosphoesterase
MIIAATGDIHSPRFYTDFIKAVDEMRTSPDLFLLAGDIVDRARVDEYERIYNALFGKVYCPIVACFGNTEFIPDKRAEIKRRYREIRFLDDESAILKLAPSSAGIFGTIGSLDIPTTYQLRNIPDIREIYQRRIALVQTHMKKMITGIRILLIHYSPTYKSLEGENPRFYGSMGSKLYERVLLETKPHLVIHGHSHHGRKMVWLDTVPIFNVSLPLNKEIVIIDTKKLKPGLTKFME